MSLRLRAPLVREPPRLLEGGSGLAEQDGIPSQAKDKIDPTPMREYVEALWGSNRTIATDQHMGVRPMVPQIRQQPDQEHGLCGPRRASSWTQGDRDQGVRGPFENAEWQRAIVLIVMIREGKLLLPLCGSIGVVEIEDNGWGRLGGTRDAVVHQGRRETIEVLAVYLVFQAGAGGRIGSVLRSVQGGPLHTECDQGGAAAAIGVVPVCIPRRAWIDALGQAITQRRVNRGLMPLLMDRCRQARRQPNLPVNSSQEECTEVRRQGHTLKIGTASLSTDRRKTQLLWARIGHKQTSCGLYGMVVSHLPFSQRLTRGLSVFMKNLG